MWERFPELGQGEIPIELKRNDDGGVILSEDGYPIYVDKDGKDIPVNVPKLYQDLKSANAESAGRRKELDTLNQQIVEFQEKYKDLDPEVARDALEKLKNLKEGDLTKAEDVEKLKLSIKEGFEEQIKRQKSDYEKLLDEERQKVNKKDSDIRQLLIKSAFDGSRFIKEKTNVPPDMAFRYFGDFFEVRKVNGQLRAVGKYNNDDIMFKAHPGEIADTEEAIEFLIDKYPGKETILRGSIPSGSGFFSPDARASEQPRTLGQIMYPSMTDMKK